MYMFLQAFTRFNDYMKYINKHIATYVNNHMHNYRHLKVTYVCIYVSTCS
jgi:hypothetical protein